MGINVSYGKGRKICKIKLAYLLSFVICCVLGNLEALFCKFLNFSTLTITDINSHSNSYIIKLTSPQAPTAWVACDYPRPPATQAKPAYNKTAVSSFLCILKRQVKDVRANCLCASLLRI